MLKGVLECELACVFDCVLACVLDCVDMRRYDWFSL